MIVLTNTTDSIQIVLAAPVAAFKLEFIASYRDTTTTTIEAKRNVGQTNGLIPESLIAAPASSTQRIVDYLSIFNSDTASSTVTIRFNDNGTLFTLFTATLAIGERIEYQEGHGFKVMSSLGAIRVTNNTGSTSATSVMGFNSKSIDQSTTSSTFTDIANLDFPVKLNKSYWFRFIIPYTVNATTTGCRFAVNGPASPIKLYYATDVTSSTTARAVNRGISTYNGTTTSTASATTGSNLAFIEGIITPSANGTVTASFSTELAGQTVTQKAGAVVQYLEI